MNTENQIEAILFYKNEPVSKKELSKMLQKTEMEISKGIDILKQNLENRGLTLIEEKDSYSLATSKEVSELIEKIAKEELSKDIGKAGLETLSIIIYQNPISRREIDYIRGVNSNFILRSLLIRGLIEKTDGEGRGFQYKPSIRLLAHLGIKSVEDLPKSKEIDSEIKTIMNASREAEKED